MYIPNKIKGLAWKFSRQVSKAIEPKVQWELAKSQMTQAALTSTESGVSNEQYLSNSQVIVSLTTYGKRLANVYQPIESIMQGSMKPNRIILWLENELKNTVLSITLQRQMKRGLEVRFCKNLRSYKKLVPSFVSCPNDVIITIDDDVIYRFDMVERLVRAYQQDPQYVYCSRMHRMKLDSHDNILPYNDWDWCVDDDIVSPLNFPTGCGGALYPPPTSLRQRNIA